MGVYNEPVKRKTLPRAGCCANRNVLTWVPGLAGSISRRPPAKAALHPRRSRHGWSRALQRLAPQQKTREQRAEKVFCIVIL